MESGYTLLVLLCALSVGHILGISFTADQRLDGNVFYTFARIPTAQHCGQLCLQSSRCEAFNFRLANASCSLIDQRVNSSVVAEVGFMTSDIADWNTDIAGQCKTKPCNADSFCVSETSSHVCVTAGWALAA